LEQFPCHKKRLLISSSCGYRLYERRINMTILEDVFKENDKTVRMGGGNLGYG
jgi:hypothetical protein